MLKLSAIKKLPLILGPALALSSLICWYGRGEREGSRPDAPVNADLSPSELGIYTVSVHLRQEKGSTAPTEALALEGELEQGLVTAGRFRTQWTRLDKLVLLNEDATLKAQEAMLQLPIFSELHADGTGFEHRSRAISNELTQSLQANLLNKMLLPFKAGSKFNLQGKRQEADELGSYEVVYHSQKRGSGFRIAKQWQSYASGLLIDTEQNTLVYDVDASGRLLELSGQLGLSFQNIHYVNTIQIKLKGSEPAPVTVAHESRDADMVSVTLRPQQNANETDFVTVMQRLDALTQASPAAVAYQIFADLKQDLNAHPEHGEDVAQKILDGRRDESSKRRLTVLFGALAQSNHAAHADLLAKLSKQCGDSFCKVQALVALSDHRYPTEQAAEAVLELASQKANPEVQGTALLTAGTLGQKLDSGLPELSEIFTQQLDDPRLSDMKSTILAAMGNHGRPDYLPIFNTYINAKDINQRLAAVYGMRFIPGAETTLLELLNPSQDKAMINEAYKALSYQSLSRRDYKVLAARSANLEDEDLQIAAARSLVRVYERHPDLASDSLESLKNQTHFAAVRQFIEGALLEDTAAVPSH